MPNLMVVDVASFDVEVQAHSLVEWSSGPSDVFWALFTAGADRCVPGHFPEGIWAEGQTTKDQMVVPLHPRSTPALPDVTGVFPADSWCKPIF